MAKTAAEITGPGSFQEAMKKARYGHRDWIVWRSPTGRRAAVKNRANVKRMLLDTGTKGDWSLICAGGTPTKGFWWLGVNLIRQCELGM